MTCKKEDIIRLVEENQLQQTTQQEEDKQKKTSDKPYELQPTAEASLCYLIPPITGIMVLVYEKKNQFVREHAMHSIVGFVAYVLATNIGVMTEGIYVGYLIRIATVFVGVYLWITSAYKAFNDQELDIPIITPLSRDLLKKL